MVLKRKQFNNYMDINFALLITTFDNKGSILSHMRFGAATKERCKSMEKHQISKHLRCLELSADKRVYYSDLTTIFTQCIPMVRKSNPDNSSYD